MLQNIEILELWYIKEVGFIRYLIDCKIIEKTTKPILTDVFYDYDGLRHFKCTVQTKQ